MDKLKNKPQLRFPEFKGAWENKRLGELLEFKNGINATKEQYGSGIKFINVLDILNNDYITHNKIIGSVNVEEDVMKKNQVTYGDILFQRSSETREEVGTANVYLDKEKNATFGGFVIRGKAIVEYNPIFLNKLLKTDLARDEITSKSGGSTRYNVGQDTLSSVCLYFPDIPEQQKIASFLSAVDEKIQALKKKKALLEQYKKGVMQQIFNQEIRFKDDDGNDYPDWEEKKVGDIVIFTNGKAHENEIDKDGLYVVVNSKFISTNGKVRKYSDKNISPLLKNDIVLVMSDVPNGKTLGKCFLIDRDNKYTLNQRICSLREVNVYNPFLFYIINRNDYYLSFDSGVGQTNLKKEDVLNCPIVIPISKEEQIKIANFLSAIDDKIVYCQNHIDKSELWKKGLLQQMFV